MRKLLLILVISLLGIGPALAQSASQTQQISQNPPDQNGNDPNLILYGAGGVVLLGGVVGLVLATQQQSSPASP